MFKKKVFTNCPNISCLFKVIKEHKVHCYKSKIITRARSHRNVNLRLLST